MGWVADFRMARMAAVVEVDLEIESIARAEVENMVGVAERQNWVAIRVKRG